MDQGRQRGRPKNASSPASWQKNWRERAPSNCISSETASAKSSRSRIPKHFEQPLTCFYWHRYGHCKKAGEDCWYAHFDTGMVAAAPFKMESEERAMAGQNATEQLNKYTKKQQALNSTHTVLRDPQAMDGIIGGVYEIIGDANAILHEALVTLNHHNEAIAVDDEDIRSKASKVVEAAAVDISGIVERLTALETQAERQLGRPVSLSESDLNSAGAGQS